MTDEPDNAWPSPEALDQARRQVRELRDSAREGGLQFQAYLPPEIALWLLDHIEKGAFLDPSEAPFTLFHEAKALEPHADLCGASNKVRFRVNLDETPWWGCDGMRA